MDPLGCDSEKEGQLRLVAEGFTAARFKREALQNRTGIEGADENTDKKIAIPMDKNEANSLTRTMPLSRDAFGFQ